MKVSRMTHLVDDQGAARSAGIRPALNAGSEHEVIKHQLPPPFEQIPQVRWTTRAGEEVVFLDPVHRLTAPLRREGVARASRRLLFGEEFGAPRLPLGL